MAMSVGSGGARARAKVRPEMNVTPLVDVVLVLLIIFMVVTPLLTKQLWMHVPPTPPTLAPPPPADTLPPLVLTLGKDLQTRLNGEPVPRGALVEKLQSHLRVRADKVVFFDAADGLPYAQALAVMDEVKGGGIENLAVLAEPLR